MELCHRPKITESARNKLDYFLAVDSRYSSNAGTTVCHTSHTLSANLLQHRLSDMFWSREFLLFNQLGVRTASDIFICGQ